MDDVDNQNLDDTKIKNEVQKYFSSTDFKKDVAHYREIVCYMSANVPLGVLCLPVALEKILIREGYIRVYDLLNRDLSEIRGIGKTRRDLITARLDQFFSVEF